MSANLCDFKLVLLGDVNVGKTSLVVRYVRNHFLLNGLHSTIGAAFCAKVVNSNGKKYTLGIWDTAGSERFDALTRLYYRGAHAAVLCYTPTCLQSWNRLRLWLAELRTVEENCKIYICGTKKDLLETEPREVPDDVISTYSQELQGHMLVSSKTGEGVDELFQKITDDLASDVKLTNELKAREIAIHEETRRQYSGCQIKC